MKVLVTGAAGLLGRQVAAQLAADGHRVRAHDLAPLPDAVAALAAETAHGDLTDPGHAAEAVAGVDAVVHAAALPSPFSGTETEVFTVNVNGTYQVLNSAGHAGVRRIVHVSSLSALGLAWSSVYRAPEHLPLREDHPVLAEDVYGLSKHLGETIAETTARRFGATVVSLRFPFLGDGERLERHLAYVAEDQGRDRGALWGWLHTADAARAVAAALTADLDGWHLINVTAPDTAATTPSRELVARHHPTVDASGVPDGFGTLFATDRAERLLGFTAEHRWRPASTTPESTTPDSPDPGTHPEPEQPEDRPA